MVNKSLAIQIVDKLPVEQNKNMKNCSNYVG